MGGDAGMNLEAYRRCRLEEARLAAQALEVEAAGAATRRLAEAAHAAETILAKANAEATAEADRDSSAALARDRRRARRTVLEAKRAAYEDMIARVRAGAAAMRTEPSYHHLMKGLERAARRRFGDAANVVTEPAPAGGIVAHLDGRRVDYSLPALAEWSVGELGAEVERLWR